VPLLEMAAASLEAPSLCPVEPTPALAALGLLAVASDGRLAPPNGLAARPSFGRPRMGELVSRQVALLEEALGLGPMDCHDWRRQPLRQSDGDNTCLIHRPQLLRMPAGQLLATPQP